MFTKTKEKIAAVQAIPDQMKLIASLAVAALIIAFVAMAMSVGVNYRAN